METTKASKGNGRNEAETALGRSINQVNSRLLLCLLVEKASYAGRRGRLPGTTAALGPCQLFFSGVEIFDFVFEQVSHCFLAAICKLYHEAKSLYKLFASLVD